MPLPLLSNRQLLLIKAEATFNVDATPAKTTDAVQCEEPDFTPDLTVLERNFIKPDWSRTPHALGRKLAKVKFVTEVKGGGTAGVQCMFGRLLTFCGMKEVIVATTSATYTPSSDPTVHKSATIYLYKDGLLHIMTGCFGTMSIEAAVNGYAKATFEFTGQYYDPTDVALPTGPTYEATLPHQVEEMTFEIDSYSAAISKLAFDLGVSVLPRLDANGTDGYNGTYIDKRNVTGGIDPEATLVSDEAFWAKLSAANSMALTGVVCNGGAGNTVTVTAPAVQYTNMSYASRDRIVTLDAALAFNGSTGDDEISIALT